MIPENTLSTTPQTAQFLSPDNLDRGPLRDAELGGVALEDTSQGLSYQKWLGKWSLQDKNASLTADNTPTPIIIFSREEVIKEFSFCFDQLMRWQAVVVTEDNKAYLYWYDSLMEERVITEFDGIISARLALDDKRALSLLTGQADVLFTYLRTDRTLCIRNQRDRFLVEYELEEDIKEKYRISRFGMNRKFRMQWELSRSVN